MSSLKLMQLGTRLTVYVQRQGVNRKQHEEGLSYMNYQQRTVHNKIVARNKTMVEMAQTIMARAELPQRLG